MQNDVYINNQDAFMAWGVNLEDGALSALMTPAPMKPYIQSKSRTQHGKNVNVNATAMRVDERELTLPFHIIVKAPAQKPEEDWEDPNVPEYYTMKETFMLQYNKFCDEVLLRGSFTLETRFQEGVVYNLLYQSCTQFTQFDQRMAHFILKVSEPKPWSTYRTAHEDFPLPPTATETIIYDITEL